MAHEAGQKIVFELEQKPVEGEAISAAFGNSNCLTRCPHKVNVKVGSLSCQRCKSYGGSLAFAIATGSKGACGSVTHHRNIYCKLQEDCLTKS